MKLEWTKEYCKMEYLKGIPKRYIISLQHLRTSEAEIELVHGLKTIKKQFGDKETMRRIAGEWAIQLRDEFEGRDEG